jgi:hypothetical protein
MLCRQSCRALRRDYKAAARRVRTPCRSFTKVDIPRLSIRSYSASDNSPNPSNKDKVNDETVRNMDFDAIEKMLKDRLGDHASWSHEQLLSLMICKLQLPKH